MGLAGESSALRWSESIAPLQVVSIVSGRRRNREEKTDRTIYDLLYLAMRSLHVD